MQSLLCHSLFVPMQIVTAPLKSTEVLRKVLKQNLGYTCLVCCPLCSLKICLSTCVSKSFCNITPRFYFHCNLLLAILFGITSLHGFVPLRECAWIFPTLHEPLWKLLLNQLVISCLVNVFVLGHLACIANFALLDEENWKWWAWSMCHLFLLFPLPPFFSFLALVVSKNIQRYGLFWLSVSGLTLILCVGSSYRFQ